MRLLMRADRTFQDAGRERLLYRGETYDLPEIVAQAFLATGAAERVDDDPKPPASAAARRAPERKPTFPPETKGAA